MGVCVRVEGLLCLLLEVAHGLLVGSREVLLGREALDAVVDADLAAGDEVPRDEDPGRVVRQRAVQLGRHGLELRQAGPGDVGEVVVLVVVAHVEREPVERAVVRERLMRACEDVVLADKVPRTRVQRAREERRGEEVQQRAEAEKVVDDGVKGKLNNPVGQEHDVGLLVAHNHRAQGVEEDLVGAEERLGKDVVEDDALDPRRQVRVVAVDTLEAVVLCVVRAERDGVGQADGEVRKHRERAVGDERLEREVVADLVDGQEERVVAGGADDVGHRPEAPRVDHVADEERGGKLDEDVGRDPVERGHVGPVQRLDLGVRLERSQAPCDVRMRLLGPEEVAERAGHVAQHRLGEDVELGIERVAAIGQRQAALAAVLLLLLVDRAV
eukprot:Unigene1986_Nuclearia_a/m.6185 Unigene1986_Nuclearia_a/g.6185  ORF Unigene1986_Nuclearia_a/g.6185 Unigene1986_Nuclearia_a/m.6185 type:complete len:385 (+) Unigene1986_Nuclearia_a:121-1275(+)